MNRLRALTFGLVIVLLVTTAGCRCETEEGKIFTITVRAYLDDEGVPTFSDEHDDVAVFPGERVRWLCDCPGIDRFAVRDVQHLASIDELVDLYLEMQERGGVPAMSEAAARFERALAVEGEGLEMERREATAGILESHNVLLEHLGRTLRPDAGEAFETPVRGDFVPADEAIESSPYVGIEGNHIWKFTWVIQAGEQTASWDPHFSGHRRR